MSSNKHSKPLSVTHPEFAKMAVGWDPTRVTYGSKRVLEWKCDKGHLFKRSPKNLTVGGACSVCIGKELTIGVNDLQTKFPELAAEALGWDPSTIHSGAVDTELQWKCSVCDYIWKTSPERRTKYRKSGCPVCSRNNLTEGTSRRVFLQPISVSHPLVARKLIDFDPTEVTAGSRRYLEWKCDSGHIFRRRVQDICKNDTCPICTGNKILPGVNDLKTKFPEIASEAFGWDPSKIATRSKDRLTWLCSKNHQFVASVRDRTRQDEQRHKGTSCPFCSGKKVLIGFNDFATTHPELAGEVLDVDTSSFSAGSEKLMKWKCSEGHVWKARPYGRSQGSGCPSCAKHGYDPNKDGYFYFLRHSQWGLLQIGITNDPKGRLHKHERSDWEVIDLLGPRDGLWIREFENQVKDFLIKVGASVAPSEVAGKFDGFTESWIESTFQLR
jgi:hypothetical protein